MTAKLTEPQERCPVCGENLGINWWTRSWGCAGFASHEFYGPCNDPTGRGVDRMIRAMKRRIVREAGK